MLGYMNEESLEKTKATGWVTFWSRSRKELWTKGETSGNRLKLDSITLDCDRDTFLVKASPEGPVCHTGTATCFGDSTADFAFLNQLEEVLEQRKSADPDASYTAQLYQEGVKKIAQKVGEEGVEVALEAMSGDLNLFLQESADLMFHLLVLLSAKDCTLSDVITVLKKRHGKPTPQ